MEREIIQLSNSPARVWRAESHYVAQIYIAVPGHDKFAWNFCRLNPYAEFAYDGLLLNPLEVLFVKVKAFQMQADWMSALMAGTYDRWLSQVNPRPNRSSPSIFNQRCGSTA